MGNRMVDRIDDGASWGFSYRRRRLLQIAGLGSLGLGFPQLFQAQAAARDARPPAGLAPIRSCIVLFNYGAERLPAAVTGVLTAAIPALGYLFALLLGEPFDAITALGGAIALVGVVIASVATPSVEASPPGSAIAR